MKTSKKQKSIKINKIKMFDETQCHWGCFNKALPKVEQWWRYGLDREAYSLSFQYCQDCRDSYVDMCNECEEVSGDYTDFSKEEEYVEWKERQEELFNALDPYFIPDLNRMICDYL